MADACAIGGAVTGRRHHESVRCCSYKQEEDVGAHQSTPQGERRAQISFPFFFDYQKKIKPASFILLAPWLLASVHDFLSPFPAAIAAATPAAVHIILPDHLD